MDALDAIMTTRAIRRFRPDPVPDELIWTCLRAAQQGPSGGNVQPQQYVVITDPEQRADVARLYRAAFDRYSKTLPDLGTPGWKRSVDASQYLADHLGEVPVIVVILQASIPWEPSDDDGPIDIGRLDASVYPAVQNFCVAARAVGLGTTLTTVIRSRTPELFDVLGVPPDRFEVAALLPLGYPVGSFGVAPRKPVEKVTHWDRYGNRR